MALGVPSYVAAAEPAHLYVAARKERDGSYAAAIFDLKRGELSRVTLPRRGHGAARRPGSEDCVIFARRPGTFAVCLDARGARPPRWFRTAPDRHFYGHGVFSPDGRLLYATENDYETGVGTIGVRDAEAGFRSLGELPSHGIGPHDIALLSDGRTLVVANGGIQTHPESGRTLLNRGEMAPSLVYLDRFTGDLLERHALSGDLKQLSIRHLAVAAGDVVVLGCQHKGSAIDRPPLIAFHRRGRELAWAEAPRQAQADMRNYVGSVAVDRSGTVAAVSSPRGGLVTYWDTETRAFLGQTRLEDVCGLAPSAVRGAFVLTSGTGAVRPGGPAGGDTSLPAPSDLTKHHWDNHLMALG